MWCKKTYFTYEVIKKVTSKSIWFVTTSTINSAFSTVVGSHCTKMFSNKKEEYNFS